MLTRLKLSSENRTWDILAVVLLACAILTSVTRLVVTKWTEELYAVQTLAFLGVLLGFALGYSRFSPRFSIFLGAAYGLVAIPWQMGLTLGPGYEWKVRLEILNERLGRTINLVLRSRPVDDNVLFVLLMSILFWVISVHAGYSLVRHGNAWRAILPAGLTMLVIHSYDPYITRRIWFLAVYLFFTLLLVARVTFIRQRAQWKQNRTFVAPDLGFDWIRFTLLASVILIIFSWAVPAVAETLPPARQAWQYIRRPWVELQDKLSNAFSSLQSSVGIISDYYGDTLSLGRGSVLSDTPVLIIDSGPKYTGDLRYYWRAYAYDRYEDGQWRNTLQETANLTPDSPPFELPGLEKQWETQFTITPRTSIATLYTSAQVLWLSVPATANVTRDEQGRSVDMTAFQARPSVTAGKKYEVRSSISIATEADLQTSGTDYPQWVKDAYLQLPSNITLRTRQLASELAKGHDNPYDIAKAITDYLRTYEYSEVIEQPPSRQEVIDWWLFDYRKGFCQYYASAEVVLLRALGIPARMAVGYAQGEFRTTDTIEVAPGQFIPDPSTNASGTYTVRQRDAHAWPEVYFVGYGWIEFEPTASQSPIFRRSGREVDLAGLLQEDDNLVERGPGEDRAALERAKEAATRQEEDASARARLILSTVMILLAGGLVLLAVILRQRGVQLRLDLAPVPIRLERGIRRMGLKPPAFLRRWAHYASLSPLVHAYLEINRALKRLGKPAGVQDTPAERGAALSGLLPVVTDPTQLVVAEYQRLAYSRSPNGVLAAREAGKVIRNQSYLALLKRLLSRLQEPAGRNHRH